MTVSVNGEEIGQAIEIALAVGGALVLLLAALFLYLLVRPPRRVREAKRAERRGEPEAIDAEEMIALIDRMESRLEVLERAVGDGSRTKRQRLLETGEAPATRRTK
jgi:hypothetical protein